MPALTEQLPRIQEQQYWHPAFGLPQDIYEIYGQGKVEVGWPYGAQRLWEEYVRNYSTAIIGLMLGDEGKGRLVDNKIGQLLKIPGVELAYVIRFQGGANSGHTIKKGDTQLALHQVPSGVLYPEVVGIMDRGMVIHPEDLKVEIEDLENVPEIGDLRGKLFLSEEAILCTDLERAEEVLNRVLSGGKSKGGTGRGIAPSYAHFYDRLGVQVKDLFEKNWREKFAERYERYEKYFAAFGHELAYMDVPDLRETRSQKKATPRKVGSKEEYLDRLESVRKWYLERDEGMEDRKMITNTFLLHQEIYQDLRNGILFEGGQAVGLHPFLGGRPDVTSSDTSAYGIMSGTAVYRPRDIADRTGVFKLTYTSKVPHRDYPTAIEIPGNLPEDLALWDLYIENNKASLTPEQVRAIWIIKYANEIGTTTGRLRGIQNLDLEMMRYNARFAGIEVLGATHLDVARKGEPILVCTHYTKDGKVIKYQPGLEYMQGVKPHYALLPGWDGEEAKKAKSFDELPLTAKQFLTFVQKQTGFPIVVATTGEKRKHIVQFRGYDYVGPQTTAS